MNPTRTLREALKISQQQLAAELSVSIGLIRAYESGTRVSEGSMAAMKTLAEKRGFSDLAAQMGGMDGAVSQVIDPLHPEEIRLRTTLYGAEMSAELHAALDVILSKGRPDAIGSVDFLLRAIKAQTEAESGAHLHQHRKPGGGKGRRS
jgi:transcriptional regulator with XRE-family HTH domain